MTEPYTGTVTWVGPDSTLRGHGITRSGLVRAGEELDWKDGNLNANVSAGALDDQPKDVLARICARRHIRPSAKVTDTRKAIRAALNPTDDDEPSED